jgi:transaldolase
MFSNYDFETEIIVASIRNPLHFVDAAMYGAHIATVPYNVLEQLIRHPLTDIGIQKFLKDWEKVPK